MVSRPDLTIDQLKRRVGELESQLRRRHPSDEDRLADEQQARETAELLNRIGLVLIRELGQEKVIQSVTDIAIKLVGAEFGSFVQYGSLPKDVFAGLPMPRNGTVRSTHDNPQSALRSYVAAPVVSRSGELLGGLFFGHSAPGRFTERHEALIGAVAGQAAVAIDNARLFEQARWVQYELKRANEDLRRANRDLETFSYSASHDLQEPLRKVALGAQLLQLNAGNKLDPEQTQFLDSILQGARRMEALVQALLTYTQAIRHADGPVPSVSAEKVLSEVVESLKYRIEECGAKVTAAPLPVLTIHEVHLTQLFQNLISNALKYRQPEAPSIHFSAIQEDGWTVLSVADNGIGLELKYADQIFSLFKRLHSGDDYPGSGIGLAICQRIVEQYGGRIWLEKSKPGAGSTFCISIPDRRTGP
jgi:signal transduction histidine kinase